MQLQLIIESVSFRPDYLFALGHFAPESESIRHT
jgi:hypothetical protein